MIATDKKWKDKHIGEECLIIGGGYREQLDTGYNIINPYGYKRCERLDRYPHTVIGCNSAYHVRRLDYIVIKDPWVWDKLKDEYKKLDATVFYVGTDKVTDDFVTVKKAIIPHAGASFSEGVISYLSGYCAVHIALLLGFDKIYLSGFLGGNTMLKALSQNFIFLTEWIAKYGRQIYVTDKNSILKDIFKYERLPLTEK